MKSEKFAGGIFREITIFTFLPQMENPPTQKGRGEGCIDEKSINLSNEYCYGAWCGARCCTQLCIADPISVFTTNKINNIARTTALCCY